MRVKIELGPELLRDDQHTMRDWSDICQGTRSHFMCGDDGDWVVTICGLLIPERDVMGGQHKDPECRNCTRAIEKIKSMYPRETR